MRNGQAVAIPAELLEALTQRREPRSEEDKNAQATAAFNKLIDEALNGCLGAKDDASHRERDEAIVTLLRNAFNMQMLPTPVADGVCRMLAHQATHGNESVGEAFRALFDGGLVGISILVAGVTLRVLEDANKRGVTVATGQYL